MSEYETIRYETDGPILTVTFNRPDAMNGITNTMMRELHEAMVAASKDEETSVLVLTGEGRAFCAGADLNYYASEGPKEPNYREYFNTTALLHEMPKVTIAAINGACAGAAFGWACACDLRYAAEGAAFNTAFLDVGLSGDMAGPWSLPRIVGAAKARELYFLPGKFRADEAERIGLVSRVFPKDDFRSEIEAITSRLASAPPVALRSMKKNFLTGESSPLREYISVETERHAQSGGTEDATEARSAFLEKREGVYRGR